jgi:hypothetical protein
MKNKSLELDGMTLFKKMNNKKLVVSNLRAIGYHV